MNASVLVMRSLRFHWRRHAAALLGAAVSAAVIAAALVVGAAVRSGVDTAAQARLGQVRLVLAPGDRLFRSALAENLRLGAVTAPALALRGSAATPDNRALANNVRIIGVDSGFFALAPDPQSAATPSEGAVLTRNLADRLGVAPGGEVILRAPRPRAIPLDAPFALAETVPLRLKVEAVADDNGFGGFALDASPEAPFNAFVPLRLLQERTQSEGRANMLLLGETDRSAADVALADCWTIDDAGLAIRDLPARGEVELRSSRVFIEPAAARAAVSAAHGAKPALAYFVHEVRSGSRVSPFSMVAALAPGTSLLPPDIKDDEIAVNQWLSDDLGIAPGAEIELTYYALTRGLRLDTRTARFRVRSVIPLADAAIDPDLMPEFPGMSEAKECKDWKAGVPLDLGRVRPKDEEYWKAYRGTPKAFVTLAAGQRMWANRFGSITAVRYPRAESAGLEARLRGGMTPAEAGLFFTDAAARSAAVRARGGGFTAIFMGFSVFIVAAAAAIAGLGFALAAQRRAGEAGTLLALGFSPRRVRMLFLAEAAVLSLAGAGLGAVAGLWYGRAVLDGLAGNSGRLIIGKAVILSDYWSRATLLTLVEAAAAGALTSMAAAWLATRGLTRRPVRRLLAGIDTGESADAEKTSSSKKAFRVFSANTVLAFALAAAAGALSVAFGRGSEPSAAAARLGAGALALAAGLTLCAYMLRRLGGVGGQGPAHRLTLAGLGVRNAGRRRGASLTAAAALACGLFILAAAGIFRRAPVGEDPGRASGAGGFSLVAVSAAPITKDLNDSTVRRELGLDGPEFAGAEVFRLRVRDGDDASCFSMGGAPRPRLLGVGPAAMRGRFTFVHRPEGTDEPWAALAATAADGATPAVIDQATAWTLEKSAGDVITYEDERGGEFQVRIAGVIDNSVLHGAVVISEEAFIARYPSEGGYRMLLVEGTTAAAGQSLMRALGDLGLEVSSASAKLDEVNAVENAYIAAFQSLGGLGLALGTAGLGALALRGLMERRGELAMMRAIGFRRADIRWAALIEHGLTMGMGLACGLAAALMTAGSALADASGWLAAGRFAAFGIILAALGLFWVWLAAAAVLRGRMLEMLREE
jgi:putative ABC transport system permease protein